MIQSPIKNTLRNTVHVDLQDRSYNIHIGFGLLKDLDSYLNKYLRHPKVAIVTEKNVADLHLSKVTAPLDRAGIERHTIILEPGEKSKSWSVLQNVVEKLINLGLERNDVVIAFGGGMIGDLVGFASSILYRGVDCIQIPTTFLSQVDSAVGGKTGINSPHGKNLIGTFTQPKLVLNDLELILTLPCREYWSGYAEVLKYGLINDADFFDWLDNNKWNIQNRDAETIMKMVQNSCHQKVSIVKTDEKEQGSRALLNLGHTFGHAFETITGYSGNLLHGEGVSIGCNLAFQVSKELGLCSKEELDRLVNHMKSLRLVYKPNQVLKEMPTSEDLIEIMKRDKKSRQGQIRFILVKGIGKAFISGDVNLEIVKKAIQANLM